MTRAAHPPTPALTEKEWMRQVVDLARLLNWKHYHPLMSMKSMPGFPDLVLCRERVIFAELKTAKGVLSPHQITWRDALQTAGAEWHLWRPADAETVLATLRRRHA